LDSQTRDRYRDQESSGIKSLLEVAMSPLRLISDRIRRIPSSLRIPEFPTLLMLFLLLSATANAQGTPLDTGFTNLQNLFTGTVAKVGSLIAIVVGGYQFAHGEPGAKRALAGVAAGTGIAVLAANVLTWLWG
jgi:type IV secretory pathway VirB2 component (pilin)